MRRCHHCGGEFGILRHVFLRGEFCSEACSETYQREEARLRVSIKSAGAADHVSTLTPTGKPGGRGLAPVVVQLQEGSTEVPLYFIGAEFTEFRLAQAIGPGRAIFGVNAPWPLAWRQAAANNQRSAFPTMEQLAAPYARGVRMHACCSPCILVGFSLSGLIAFEIAHQLERRGVNVEMVILLDSRPQYPPPYRLAWQKLQEVWERPPNCPSTVRRRLTQSWPVVRWTLAREFRRLGRYLLQTFLRDPGQSTGKFDEEGMRLPYGLIERLWLSAAKSYRPRRLDCRGVLFWADADSERPVRTRDRSLAWGELFGSGLDIVQVPGDHITMIRGKESRLVLAQEINTVLARFYGKGHSTGLVAPSCTSPLKSGHAVGERRVRV
jgi:thioesterase domain-containing protein